MSGPDRTETSRAGPYTGRRLQGRYELGARIGVGGMGQVYEALQQPLGRRVVVKMLHERALSDPRQRGRFEREAITMSRLDHPNVVKVYDFGSDEGIDYLVMEHVEGITLQELVEGSGALDLETFTRYAVRILRAVAHAHEQGIVHRDLKPSNIMVTLKSARTDVIKVLDFGLVKMMYEEDLTQITRNGELVGSAPFLSPERILGKRVDTGADIYALGIIFYYMLSATLPFVSSNPVRLMKKHVEEPPPPLAQRLPEGRSIPEPVLELVHACLRKDPEARPSSVLDILHALRALGQGDGAVVSAITKAPPRRIPAAHVAVGVVAGCVGVVGALLALGALGGEPEVASPERTSGGVDTEIEQPIKTDLLGSVTVETTPMGATLRVGGRLHGTTPLDLSLEQGDHSLEVAAEGYRDKVVPVHVEAGKRIRLHVSLEADE